MDKYSGSKSKRHGAIHWLIQLRKPKAGLCLVPVQDGRSAQTWQDGLPGSLAHSHATLSLSLAMAPNCNCRDYFPGNLTPTLPPALLYQSAYCRNRGQGNPGSPGHQPPGRILRKVTPTHQPPPQLSPIN